MKMPTDKKTRGQILILIALAAAGVVYAVFSFVVLPCLRSRREVPKQLEEIEARLSQAERIISSVPENIEKHNAAVAQINEINEKHLLQPVLGSYILEAESRIEKLAADIGVSVKNYRDEGVRDFFPGPSQGIDNYRLRSYTAMIYLETDFEKLTQLIDAFEQSNPYLSILDINVVAQPRNPQIHDIRFRVQWPIWGGGEELPQKRNE